METRAKNRPDRSKNRIPVGGKRDILTVKGKDETYKYTWVNDDRGMLERFIDGGYDFVEHDVEVGQRDVEASKGTAKRISKNVGQGVTAYLMRIPKEWHEEDMAAKAKRIDESEEDIKRTLNSGKDGTYGKVEIN